ncbi:hypothetical protein EX895_005173 [Sporisorium graminicola]|uniref:dolichyl-P-Glc:Man9GlcNAc2-PP-dolichol alpha-1,3-glucosyltransferase n=1 Tax=Sporisorium graminicola TaxID=280036 RepID=A0A4U7KN31_9BASI|nr:hypothetical protein EX895_005173 [Sporisorium graminicola]TKY85634.1 hypothetical protein EX895_005173 [Sporisorium graminicola]
MSNAFTSWQERPEKLFSSRNRNGSRDEITDDASAAHPTAKWIQEQSHFNSSSARTDELDQFGIPIHPSQYSSLRSTSKRDATLPRSPTLRSSAALKSSASSRHHLGPASTQSPDAHASPSTSSHIPDPSPSASRIVAQTDDVDEDESIGLLLGQSKRRRGRTDSYSSFGSSVLPAPLFASNARYNAHAGSNSGLTQSRLTLPAKQGRSTYPPSNHSSAAPRSRHLAPAVDTFAQQQHSQIPQPDVHYSRQRQPSNNLASRPSGFDLDDWLRASQAPAALKSSPSLGALATFDRVDRPNRAAALSEAGTRRRRHKAGSASGLSAGVLSAGPESPRSRRKVSANSNRRDPSGYSSLSSDHPALMASLELSREAESRTIDTIEEWRAKSGDTPISNASAAPSTAIADPGNGAAEQPDLVPRRRRKSSVKSASRPVSMDGPRPPLPSIPPTFGTESVTSKSGRRRRKEIDTSLVGLLSPDKALDPRRKPLATSTAVQKPPHALRDLYALSGLGSQAETPIRRLIRWLAKEQLKATIVPVVLLVSFLVRWIVGRGDWSGRGVEPLHGDFEAQRHWIELTLHLPTSKWYFYDLQYWGLDYPPLTAWVSLACGYAARLFPSTAAGFAFETSRGNEDAATAIFMRATVVVGDLLFYLPAITLFVTHKLEGRGRRTQAIALMSILLQPALILVDHGHFQYNSIMLGFSAACFALLHTTLPNPDAAASSSTAAARGRARSQAVADLSRRLSYEYVAAAIFFCLSLSFKQMALYYAPAVFAVMLGRCVGLARIDPERGLTLFIGLGLAVVGTFGVVFAPWLTSLQQAAQVVHRIFPLARGLFEDKVANVWCFLSVLPLPARFKLKNVMEATALARLSLAVTLVAILPGCVLLFWAASQTARMEMMVAHETVAVGKSAAGSSSVAGSVKAGTVAAASNKSRSRRPPSVIGSAAGAPARSEIESLLAGSVSKSISGRISHVGPPQDALATLSHDSDYPQHHAGTAGAARAVASTLPSPAAQMLPYGLLSVSSAFFLFGFQTHEKSILLPLLPMTLLLGAKGDTWGGNITSARDWEWSVWFNNMATFSLYPLLKKDGQSLQYVTLILAWNWIIGNLSIPFHPLASIRAAASANASFFRRLSTLTYLAAVGLHLVEVLAPRLAPGLQAAVWTRYPDIYPVLNVLLTTPCFAVVWVWAMVRQVQVAFANGWTVSIGSSKKKRAKS